MFRTQDYTEQLEQFQNLAHAAASAWGLRFSALTLIAYTNNAVFRVETPDGDYALKVHRPGAKPLAWIESERAWLRALSQVASLRVPTPVAEVYRGQLADGGEVYCSLATWLDGEARTLETLSTDNLRHIGEVAARLHIVSARFNPPGGFVRPRYDWDGLFGAESAYHPGDGERYFDADLRGVIDAAAERVRRTMDQLGQGADAFGLIHADLIAKNILFDEAGNIGLVDFDDCAMGYYLYDLTPILWLARNDADRLHTVADALWAGYVTTRPQPDDARAELDVFVVARHIASMRWVAGHEDHPAIRGKVEAILAERKTELIALLARVDG